MKEMDSRNKEEINIFCNLLLNGCLFWYVVIVKHCQILNKEMVAIQYAPFIALKWLPLPCRFKLH